MRIKFGIFLKLSCKLVLMLHPMKLCGKSHLSSIQIHIYFSTKKIGILGISSNIWERNITRSRDNWFKFIYHIHKRHPIIKKALRGVKKHCLLCCPVIIVKRNYADPTHPSLERWPLSSIEANLHIGF